MKIAVLVPTYRRPSDLHRCLVALAAQHRPADSVIVVCRPEDTPTLEVITQLSGLLSITTVHVHVTGVVAALNAGLEGATGDVIAITDDDAAPRPNWLSLIERHFHEQPDVGGVGGRDYIPHLGGPDRTTVGVLLWFGRQIGNHHLGVGKPRYVDMLKGVNMSFRLQAIGNVRFDGRLRGTGAQVHNELAFCLAVRRKGWKLLYDPQVAVDHYPAQRFDEDHRSKLSLLAISNSAFNETLTLLENLPLPAKPVFLLWAFLIGARDLPGFVQCLRLMLLKEPSWIRLPAVFQGRLAAVRTHLFEH
jgi:GT2 family glycosyltransferase